MPSRPRERGWKNEQRSCAQLASVRVIGEASGDQAGMRTHTGSNTGSVRDAALRALRALTQRWRRVSRPHGPPN